MRPRLFLRTAEFLWQEGHTAHATKNEAVEETMRMLDVYATFAEEFMAMPVIKGEKCSWERFPGAVNTYAIEAMMQDGKALQAGTSHFLGQNFSKASGIKFLSKEGQHELAWTTSWGVSTRLIGALIMAHGDDDGLVLPPRLAPTHVVILPIYRNDEDRDKVLDYCAKLRQEIRDLRWHDDRIEASIDDRELSGGEKKWYQVRRGVPIRVEVGLREVEAGGVSASRRDQSPRDRENLPWAEFISRLPSMLDEMQQNLFDRAKALQEANTVEITDRDAFDAYFGGKEQSGFALCPFVDDKAIADEIGKFSVTVRCIPLDQPSRPAKCFFTGQDTDRWAIFSKAY